MDRIVRVVGTTKRPVAELEFPYDPELLADVKALPDRSFDAQAKCWRVEGFGVKRPDLWLRKRGFRLHRSHPDSVVECWEDIPDHLTWPIARIDRTDPWSVVIAHRFAGSAAVADRLGNGATYRPGGATFLAPLTDVVAKDGAVAFGMDLPAEAIGRAVNRLTTPMTEGFNADEVAQVAADFRSTHLTGAEIPPWFGLDLFDYQRSGALAAAAGRRVIADEMGLGKTRSALAAVGIADPKRLLIVSPPVALTHWGKEASVAHVADPGRHQITAVIPAGDVSDAPIAEHVQVIKPARKVRDFPDTGIVIVADSLVAARPALAKKIAAWGAGAMILDESHREKTESAGRTKALIKLANTINGPRFAISGTPMPNGNPAEIIAQLAITGQVDPIFGGRRAMLLRYCFKTPFNAWVPRKKRLPELFTKLASHVWIRRRKTDVLPDLPPKLRKAMVVDVDLAQYREAHTAVIAEIREWIQEQGGYPSLEEVDAFASDSLSLISRLREAAGIAKIPAAMDVLAQWLDTYPVGEGGLYDRPLIIWGHHKVVVRAMAEAAAADVDGVEVIDGSTSAKDRDRIKDAFQAGKVPVLVASITAAGVGLTLTRSSDALFLETDWSPAWVQQAEDRIHRVATTRTVTITTMVAPDTLDEVIQAAHRAKGERLNTIMGEDMHDVSVIETTSDMTARAILQRMVNEELSIIHRAGRRSRAA